MELLNNTIGGLFMLKKMDKVLGITALTGMMFLSIGNHTEVRAEDNMDNSIWEENSEKNSIPEHMLPNSVIEYVSDDENKILEGGEAETRTEDTSVLEWAREDLMKKYNIDIEEVQTEKEKPLIPEKGLIVRYADDGQLLSVSYPDINNYARASKCASCGEAFVTGSPEPNTNYMWGGKYGNNNILYANSTTVHGYGRFTNYTDTYGQKNRKLQKGDVATRGHIDNPKAGTALTCKAPVKGTGTDRTITMYKWDIGCMPNAVLDIWYTGVEKWGYKWSSSLSISNACYEYKR